MTGDFFASKSLCPSHMSFKIFQKHFLEKLKPNYKMTYRLIFSQQKWGSNNTPKPTCCFFLNISKPEWHNKNRKEEATNNNLVKHDPTCDPVWGICLALLF